MSSREHFLSAAAAAAAAAASALTTIDTNKDELSEYYLIITTCNSLSSSLLSPKNASTSTKASFCSCFCLFFLLLFDYIPQHIYSMYKHKQISLDLTCLISLSPPFHPSDLLPKQPTSSPTVIYAYPPLLLQLICGVFA